MSKVTALGLVLVVFLVGLASGVLGARLLRYDSTGPAGPPGPPHLRGYFLHRDFDLSAEQQERLDGVLRRRQQEIEQLHRRLRPEVEELMDRTRQEVEEILTPEQLERFRERRRRWQRHPRPFGPPGDDHRRHRALPKQREQEENRKDRPGEGAG